MLSKGSMINVKKVIGVAIGIIGLGMLGIEQIHSLIEPYKLIAGVILLIGAYFLVISGRQR